MPTIVHHCVAITLQRHRRGHVHADGEHDAFRHQLEPVAGRLFLLATLPPPERLMVFVRLLVAREADVAVDPFHAEVRARINLNLGPQRAQLRAEIDNELLRRLKHVFLVVAPMHVEPVLAVVSAQRPEKPSCIVRKAVLHRGKSSG